MGQCQQWRSTPDGLATVVHCTAYEWMTKGLWAVQVKEAKERLTKSWRIVFRPTLVCLWNSQVIERWSQSYRTGEIIGPVEYSVPALDPPTQQSLLELVRAAPRPVGTKLSVLSIDCMGKDRTGKNGKQTIFVAPDLVDAFSGLADAALLKRHSLSMQQLGAMRSALAKYQRFECELEPWTKDLGTDEQDWQQSGIDITDPFDPTKPVRAAMSVQILISIRMPNALHRPLNGSPVINELLDIIADKHDWFRNSLVSCWPLPARIVTTRSISSLITRPSALPILAGSETREYAASSSSAIPSPRPGIPSTLVYHVVFGSLHKKSV